MACFPGSLRGRYYPRCQDFFLTQRLSTYIHIYYYFPTFFLCVFVSFHSCCSHAQVFGKTLVYELMFPTVIRNGTCYCCETCHSLARSKICQSKTNYNNTVIIIILFIYFILIVSESERLYVMQKESQLPPLATLALDDPLQFPPV